MAESGDVKEHMLVPVQCTMVCATRNRPNQHGIYSHHCVDVSASGNDLRREVVTSTIMFRIQPFRFRNPGLGTTCGLRISDLETGGSICL